MFYFFTPFYSPPLTPNQPPKKPVIFGSRLDGKDERRRFAHLRFGGHGRPLLGTRAPSPPEKTNVRPQVRWCVLLHADDLRHGPERATWTHDLALGGGWGSGEKLQNRNAKPWENFRNWRRTKWKEGPKRSCLSWETEAGTGANLHTRRQTMPLMIGATRRSLVSLAEGTIRRHSLELTWSLKMDPWKTIFLLQTVGCPLPC